ncbi:hypothetical protein [Paraburkholderia sp.]|uniref:hypothetical protein n=1 Tax=Paraburkholderia sp. TaxID=1926495 RepID=UPI00257ECE73|nr:hypothetical protein [Paraburkholderia sp.]
MHQAGCAANPDLYSGSAGEVVALLNRLRDRFAASGYRSGSGAVLHYTFSVGVDP